MSGFVQQGPRVPKYGQLYWYEDSQTITINTVNEYHLCLGATVSDVQGVTYTAGVTSSVSTFADYSGTVAGTVQCTTGAAHNLSSGDIVSITGTTNYNGIFEVTVIDSTNFYFTDTWVADDATGTVDRGCSLQVDSDGEYDISFQLSSNSALSAKSYKMEIIKNATSLDNIASERYFSSNQVGSASATGSISLSAGDRIAIAIMNKTDTTNMVIETGQLKLHRI